MKKTFTWFGVVVLCLAVVVCFLPGCKAEAPAPAPPSAPEWEWPSKLTIMGATPGVDPTIQLQALQPIMEKSTGVSVRVIPVEGDAVRMNMCAAGAFDIYSFTFTLAPQWLAGEEAMVAVTKWPVRIIGCNHDSTWGWMVRGDSALKTIYDVKTFVEAGKQVRVGVHMMGPSHVKVARQGLAAFLNIDPKLLTFVELANYTVYVRSIAEGKSDLVWCSSSGVQAVEAEACPQGIRWLSMPMEDKEGWGRFLDIDRGRTPLKCEWGVSSAIGFVGGSSWWLLAATDTTDEQLIYHFNKWLEENYDSYKDAYPLLARMSVDNFMRFVVNSPLPIHDGTIKYLREIGKWTAADDVWNDAAKALLQQYVDAWKAASAEATAKKIVIKMGDKAWEELWASHIKGLPPLKVRL